MLEIMRIIDQRETQKINEQTKSENNKGADT